MAHVADDLSHLTLSSEMRSKVVSPTYHIRRVLDSVLSFVMPPTSKRAILQETSAGSSPTLCEEAFPTPRVSGWSSLYSMVTFRPDVSYKEALRKERSQKDVVTGLVWALGGTAGVVGTAGLAWAGLQAKRYMERH